MQRVGVAAIGRYPANAKLIHLICHLLPSVVVREPLDKRLDSRAGSMDRITAQCTLQFNERSTNSRLIYAQLVKFAAVCNCIANLLGLYRAQSHEMCARALKRGRSTTKLNYIDLAKWNFLIALLRSSRILRKLMNVLL